MEGNSGSEGLGTRALAARALAGGGAGKYGAANPKAKLIHKVRQQTTTGLPRDGLVCTSPTIRLITAHGQSSIRISIPYQSVCMPSAPV
eukprot:7901369-Pyramimonas_sp.AAC.3